MNTVLRATTLSALIVTLSLVGCARTPSVTPTGAAPAPTLASSAAAREPAVEAAPAPPRAREVIVEEERREIVVVERPEPATFAENDHVKPIYFDFDRYDVRPSDAQILEADAAWLRTNDALVLIEGQCDERGTDEYNVALGDRRARAARSYLMAMGIAAGRITTVSYGKERPVCNEPTDACWTLNRRANLIIKSRG
jgi:peptidoglycan-associated lipoprotein